MVVPLSGVLPLILVHFQIALHSWGAVVSHHMLVVLGLLQLVFLSNQTDL